MGQRRILQTPTFTIMFHKLIKLEYKDNVTLEMTFQDGKVMRYNMSVLFDKYPALKALKNRDLFLSGKMSSYGIRWNDDLDIEAETIYQDGELVRTTKLPINFEIAYMVSSARAKSGLSQAKLSELTGIDQADISKIENGLSNPSISTLERIAKALRADLEISIK